MKIVGHRGARGLAPENTIAALHKGLEHHADMLEFDVRVSRDGVPVLHHDAEMVDAHANRRKISETSYKDLKRHDKDLATLDEALSAAGNARLYLEVKPGVKTGPIIKVLKAYPRKDQLRLASFSQQTLIELHKALPEVVVAVLERWSGIRATRRARQLGTKHIIMNQRWLWWGFIRSMSNSGYKLGTYTLNDPAKARKWQRHGLRLVVTDYPDRFEK